MTTLQIAAIIFLLQAFGVNANTIAIVRADITPAPTTQQGTVIIAPAAQSTPTQPNFGGTETPVVQSTSTPAMPDTTPFYVAQMSIDTLAARAEPPVDNGAPAGTYLRITTNKAIDLTKVVLPDGVTIGTPTYDGPPAAGQATTLIKAGGKTWTAYYYEVALTGAQTAAGVVGTIPVTIVDDAGNTITRTVPVN